MLNSSDKTNITIIITDLCLFFVSSFIAEIIRRIVNSNQAWKQILNVVLTLKSLGEWILSPSKLIYSTWTVRRRHFLKSSPNTKLCNFFCCCCCQSLTNFLSSKIIQKDWQTETSTQRQHIFFGDKDEDLKGFQLNRFILKKLRAL